MATIETILTHGYHHFDSLQLSAQDFYTSLEKMIKEYQYPEVVCKTEDLKEGGWLSAKRTYFSISWNRHKFLVCASPFGKSFFISWWHQEGENAGANIAAKFGAIGKAVANNMESKTFYQIDNEIMFISCIGSLIQRAVDKLKVEKGYTVDTKPAVN